jgi:hypothetical protein
LAAVSGSLNEDYRQAQERDGVITSLEPRSLEDVRQAIRTSNRKVLEAFRKDLAASSLSFKMIEQHANTIKIFTDAYLAACDSPRSLLDLNVDDLQRYRGGQGKNADLVSFKRLIRFLLNTGTAEQHLKVKRDTAWTVALRRSCPFSLRSCS